MNKTGRPTISEVALAAGVSVTTVSHVLNDKGRISEQTRARVRAVARRMGYPSATIPRVIVLTAFVASETREDLTDSDFYVQLVSSASATAIRHGYALALDAQSGSNWTYPHIDGAVVVDPIKGDRTLAGYIENGIPVVTIGRNLDDPERGYWLSTDDTAGTRDMLDHLVSTGSRRIALVSSPVTRGYVIDIVDEYNRWCQETGQEPMVAIASGFHTVSAGYDAGLHLLTRKNSPDTIYATTEWLALGAQLAVQHSGLTVPRDITIASYGDGPKCRAANPPITAVNIHPEITGARAVETLVDVLNGTPPRQSSEFIATQLVVRGSTRRWS